MTKLTFILILMIWAVLGIGQCLDELAHNTSNNSGWVSCQRSTNPLADFGQSHWILYEFEEVHSIETIRIWNLNQADNLASGTKRMRMDISNDGAIWTNMGTIQLGMSDGSRTYTGQEMDDMGVFEAKFVLFTALENYGGPCYGFSEVKFTLGENIVATQDEYLASLVTISPNPVDNKMTVVLSDIETRQIDYQLVDMTGRLIQQNTVLTYGSENEFTVDGTTLQDGQYALKLNTDQGAITKKVVVVHPK